MFQDIDVAVDKAVFEVNVFSLVNLTRVVLRYFLEHNREGQFAVTSSTAGVMGKEPIDQSECQMFVCPHRSALFCLVHRFEACTARLL